MAAGKAQVGGGHRERDSIRTEQEGSWRSVAPTGNDFFGKARHFTFLRFGGGMVFPREGLQGVEILTVLSAFLQITDETIRARQKEFGIEERRWPIPVALKGEDALKFKQISRGARGGSVAENVFAKVGAFTGAIKDRAGRFETAEGG